VSTEKYLAKHAHTQLHPVSGRIEGHYRASVVIPIFDEAQHVVTRLFASIPNEILIIAVINAPNDARKEPLTNTRDLLAHLKQRDQPNLVLLDHTSTGLLLPAKQGVGLARKIGTDTALAIMQRGQILSPWMYQTDADVVLPADYFSAIDQQSAPITPSGACIFPYEHRAHTPLLQQAVDLYDLHMTYYIAGLEQAQSKYAYPTLGSTIAIHADTYTAVRGYPRRNAGEDFYLLNKVRKIGQIQALDTTPLVIQARESHRVPFGTGPALARIREQLTTEPSGSSYASYALESFSLLRQAIAFMTTLPNESNRRLPRIDRRVTQILSTLGLDEAIANIDRQSPSESQRQRALHDWFDAFRTMRFLHEARRFFPDAPLLTSLAERSWSSSKAGSPMTALSRLTERYDRYKAQHL